MDLMKELVFWSTLQTMEVSMNQKEKRGNFTGQIGFILAAAGSAVGLGNIWRFPYLAAKDGGGSFLVCYLIMVVTFGFALLTTEVAIGRKTGQSPLTAYRAIHPKFGWIGVLACIVPVMILPYYCAIGGWVLKYLTVYLVGNGKDAVADGYFTSYITGETEPFMWLVIFFGLTAVVVVGGVEKGIERFSKVLMPFLVIMILGIAVFSLTLKHTGTDGVTRTGLQGLKIYLVPDFSNFTLKKLIVILMDAIGQLFYSISVAMGIMIAYGSYAKKETNLMKSINQIEFFDTAIALLAGMLIIPSVYTFMGTEGMSGGPGLIFISLPKIFEAMGPIGNWVGFIFFLIVSFAAVTSSVSVMEAVVVSIMDRFGYSRKKSSIIVILYTLIAGILVCAGYNLLYFEFELPNGAVGQILDVMDYVSNNLLMPLVALAESILVGWVVKPDLIIEEVTQGKIKFGRRKLYIVMIRFVVPLILVVLLMQALGLL